MGFLGSDWGLFECVDDAGGYWSRGLYISSENIRSTIAFPDAWSLYEVWQSLVCAVRSLV